jgi:phosphatidylserine decarboxylase
MRRSKLLILIFILVAVAAVTFWPLPNIAPVKYIERTTGEIKTEKIEGERWMKWLYYNPVGELSLQALVKRKLVSEIYGGMMDKPSSAKKIGSFAAKYNIDLSIAQKDTFTSFNDFFTRKLKPGARPVNTDSLVVVSPADGKLLVFENIGNSDFFVKGNRFNISGFLNDNALAEKYKNGILIIVRLAPPDYHRYHFPVDGKLSAPVKIDGDYFSVSPLALRKIAKVFSMNKREYLIINSPVFGDVVMAEVGATMVGTIIQTYKTESVKKGEEKGYFKFGGSTVILLFENGKIIVDSDLLKNSNNNIETTVKMGEKIATVFSN